MPRHATMAPCSHFDAKSDAALLCDALIAKRVDDEKILKLLCSRTSVQRQEIAAAFKNVDGRDLSEDLHASLTGESKELAKALMMQPAEFDAECLHNSIIDQRSTVVVEILCTRSATQLKDAESAYKAAYGRELRNDLELCHHVHDKKLLLKLCVAKRLDASGQDSEQEEQSVNKLLSAKGGHPQNLFDVLCDLLVAHNSDQLRAIFDSYEKRAGQRIEDTIETELAGNDHGVCLLAAVTSQKDPARFFAERLHICTNVVDRNVHDLVRIIVSHCETDLASVLQTYERLFDRPFELSRGCCPPHFENTGGYQRSFYHGIQALMGHS